MDDDNSHGDYSPVEGASPPTINFSSSIDYAYSVSHVSSPYGPGGPFPGCLCVPQQAKDGSVGCSICGAKWRLWRWRYSCGLCYLAVCSSCASEVRLCPERSDALAHSDDQLGGDGNIVAQRVCDWCLTSESQGNAKALDPVAAFAVLDRSINSGSAKGKVTVTELKQIMTRWGQADLTLEEVEHLVAQADLDQNGTIDYTAFVKWMDSHSFSIVNQDAGCIDVV